VEIAMIRYDFEKRKISKSHDFGRNDFDRLQYNAGNSAKIRERGGFTGQKPQSGRVNGDAL